MSKKHIFSLVNFNVFTAICLFFLFSCENKKKSDSKDISNPKTELNDVSVHLSKDKNEIKKESNTSVKLIEKRKEDSTKISTGLKLIETSDEDSTKISKELKSIYGQLKQNDEFLKKYSYLTYKERDSIKNVEMIKIKKQKLFSLKDVSVDVENLANTYCTWRNYQGDTEVPEGLKKYSRLLETWQIKMKQKLKKYKESKYYSIFIKEYSTKTVVCGWH